MQICSYKLTGRNIFKGKICFRIKFDTKETAKIQN